MAVDPLPADRDEWIDLSTPEGNARWDDLIAADTREPLPLSAYADHRARRRAERAEPTGPSETPAR